MYGRYLKKGYHAQSNIVAGPWVADVVRHAHITLHSKFAHSLTGFPSPPGYQHAIHHDKQRQNVCKLKVLDVELDSNEAVKPKKQNSLRVRF